MTRQLSHAQKLAALLAYPNEIDITLRTGSPDAGKVFMTVRDFDITKDKKLAEAYGKVRRILEGKR